MKKCKNCKYCSDSNDNHSYCLCLFFCKDVAPNQECISERQYIDNQRQILQDITNDYNSIIKSIDSKNKRGFTCKYDDINKIVWQFGSNKENCKLLIQNYLYQLKNEITKYDIRHID